MAASIQLLSTLSSTLNNGTNVFQTPSTPQSIINQDGGTSTSVAGSTGVTANDARIRLRCMRSQEQQVYGDPLDSNILAVLNPNYKSGTDGLLFPYTPSISVNQEVDYRDIGAMTHTIGDILSYNHTPSVKLSVTADFTVQNQREGRYALAAIHFLRTASKMHFGQTDKLAGLPPPILIFTGYGNFMFNNLPVILKSHSFNLDKSHNMISIQTAGGTASLPAMFQIQLELQVQQTPTAMRTKFNLEKFRTGELLSASNEPGWI